MNETSLHISQQLAHVASVLQQQRTGLAPKAVTAVLSEDTLVVTLHDALAATIEAVLEAQESHAAHVTAAYRLTFDQQADAYRVEEVSA